MTIRQALDELVVIQESLQIQEPLDLQVQKAFKLAPESDGDFKLPEPCWINGLTLVDAPQYISMADRIWDIHSQLFVGEVTGGNQSELIEAGAEFLDQFADALEQNLTLGGSVVVTTWRGGSDTIGTAVWASVRYVIVDLFVQVIIRRGVDFAA